MRISYINILNMSLLFIILSGVVVPFVPNFVFVILSFIAMVFCCRYYYFHRGTLFLFLCFFLLLFLNYLLHFDTAYLEKRYFLVFTYFVLACFFLISSQCKIEIVKNCFLFSIKFLVLHSLVGFIFQLFVGNFSLLTIGEFKVYTFNYIFFYPYNPSEFNLFRNQGLTWEPGLLQIFANLLYYYSLYEKSSKFWLIISSICVLSTFSTTGYLVFIIINLLYFIRYSSPKRKLIFLFASIPLFLIFMPFIKSNVEAKFNGAEVRSSYARFHDIYTGLNLIKDNPILGIGLGQENYYELSSKYVSSSTELNSDELYKKGDTNGILKVFYSFGIPLALVFTFLLYYQKVFYYKLPVFFIFFIGFFSEPISLTVFSFVLIGSFFLKGSCDDRNK